jgi:hypothetical protein
VEVDPGVVERKAGGACDQPLAREKQRKGHDGGGNDDQIIAPRGGQDAPAPL